MNRGPLLRSGMLFQERYRVIDLLAHGGMGAVYEIEHTETGRRLALKVMLRDLVRDDDLRARFRREARITANVISDHIVEVLDAGVDESGAPFMVLELLRGAELSDMLEAAPIELSLGLTLLRQCASALDKTHEAGIIHRDLKPANLFVSLRDDGSPNLKVLDFGIAKLVESGVVRTTRSMGTPAYMPPEQFLGCGTIGATADCYALGQIAYELLVGTPYWQEDLRDSAQMAVLQKLQAGAKEPPSKRALRCGVILPEAFDAWFFKATAVQPADRFPCASEMIEELVVLLDEGVGYVNVESPPISTQDLATFATAPLGGTTTRVRERDSGAQTALEGRPSEERATAAVAGADTGTNYTPAPAAATIRDLDTSVPSSRRWMWAAAAAFVLAGGWMATRVVTQDEPAHQAVSGVDSVAPPQTDGTASANEEAASVSPTGNAPVTTASASADVSTVESDPPVPSGGAWPIGGRAVTPPVSGSTPAPDASATDSPEKPDRDAVLGTRLTPAACCCSPFETEVAHPQAQTTRRHFESLRHRGQVARALCAHARQLVFAHVFRFADAVGLVDESIQSRARNSECVRRFANTPTVGAQGGDQPFVIDVATRLRNFGRCQRLVAGRLTEHAFERDVALGVATPAARDSKVAHGIAQLAHVAGPGKVDHALDDRCPQPLFVTAVRASESSGLAHAAEFGTQKEHQQAPDVIATLAQRWHFDLVARQPVVQRFAKTPLGDGALEVAVGRGDQPNVDLA